MPWFFWFFCGSAALIYLALEFFSDWIEFHGGPPGSPLARVGVAVVSAIILTLLIAGVASII